MRLAAALLLILSLGACTTSASPTPAPNLTSPAPEASVGSPTSVGGQCVILPIRAQVVRPSELVAVLGDQVPTRLPSSFGLLAGWTSGGAEGGSNGAIWMDARCRKVTLEIWPDGASRESSMRERSWFLVEHDRCGARLCLDYHAHSDGAAIDLSFLGLPQRDAALVIAGVHI